MVIFLRTFNNIYYLHLFMTLIIKIIGITLMNKRSSSYACESVFFIINLIKSKERFVR